MINSTDKLLIMGRSGCGKSFLGRRLQGLFPRRLIIDTLDEYGPEDGEVIHSFDEFTDLILALHETEAKEWTLIFQFDTESSISSEEFDEILRICFYHGNMLIVIEEVQDHASPHSLPHWFKQCLLKGRHRNLGMIFTSQRPGEVHKTILSQCSHIFCGTIVDGNDLRYLSTIYKAETEKLAVLPDREFLYFSRDGVMQVKNDF